MPPLPAQTAGSKPEVQGSTPCGGAISCAVRPTTQDEQHAQSALVGIPARSSEIDGQTINLNQQGPTMTTTVTTTRITNPQFRHILKYAGYDPDAYHYTQRPAPPKGYYDFDETRQMRHRQMLREIKQELKLLVFHHAADVRLWRQMRKGGTGRYADRGSRLWKQFGVQPYCMQPDIKGRCWAISQALIDYHIIRGSLSKVGNHRRKQG